MGIEIERKYLVINDDYRELATAKVDIAQGYLSRRKESTVRVRVKGDKGYITVKSVTVGAVRCEWEYEIPVADAKAMLHLAEGVMISKTRYIVPFDGVVWEIDEFHSPLDMVVAEVELSAPDQTYALPGFIGREVTGDPRYYNSNISGRGGSVEN